MMRNAVSPTRRYSPSSGGTRTSFPANGARTSARSRRVSNSVALRTNTAYPPGASARGPATASEDDPASLSTRPVRSTVRLPRLTTSTHSLVEACGAGGSYAISLITTSLAVGVWAAASGARAAKRSARERRRVI